ncbi:MAG: putative spermidine/putrescine transport system permease protein [Clostridium sp.]|jgi:putative spermidine/putrescine transport system permease protein
MKKLILLLTAIIILFPMMLVLLLSVFSYYRYPLLFPEKFTLGLWKNTILGNSQFYVSVLNSIVIGMLNAVLATLVGIMTARALVKYTFFGDKFIKIFFSFPLFIPSIALFMGVHLMMIKLHLINSFTGVILTHMLVSVPYATNIFISFFKGINPNMENIARTMGCTQTKIYSKILLPLLAPGIYLSFSIGFLISFSEYFSTFLIGGGKVLTLSSMLYPYISSGDTGNAAVLGVIFILVNISVFFIADILSRKRNKIENYLFE